jgi:glycosyltransferase involved in cell wall biosynthesis
MTISVLLCTYNRAQKLTETLNSMIAQSLPSSYTWETVVVDNNSSDETRQVVEELQRQFPDLIRYVFEAKQGISNARNTAIRESRGQVLAFIDDDETADPTWLRNLTEHLHDGEWVGAGGRVLPPPGFVRPAWLQSKGFFVHGPLASFDLGEMAGQLNEPPFGANMAFRREVFEEFGFFRTDLGRSGNNLISNEDTEFGRRLMAAGLRLRYEPSAVTYHPVEAHRLEKSYFLHWWFNKGRSDVRELGYQSNVKGLFGVSFRLIASLVRSTGQWMVSIEPAVRFAYKIAVWNCVGQVVESLCQRAIVKQTRRNDNSYAEREANDL